MRCRSLGAIRAAAAGSTRAQALVQRAPAKLRRFAIELGTDGSIGARQRREAVAQRAQIEQRAADEQRQPAARADLGDRARAHRARSVLPSTTPSARGCRRGDAARAARIAAEGFAVPMSRPR